MNNIFLNKESFRRGAQDSATALKDSLEKIGYVVEVEEDLTAEGMKEKLVEIQSEIRPDDDSLIHLLHLITWR